MTEHDWGAGVTDREPTPAPRTVGFEGDDTQGGESARTRARVRARIPQLPPAPALLRALFVGDNPSPFTETLPRLHSRVDYILHGNWCDPDATKLRWAVLIFFGLPVACPISIAIDLADWACFPLGRLLATAGLIWLVAAIT